MERGLWRIYNPYNPYVEEPNKNNSGGVASSLESLDELFEDDLTESKPAKENKMGVESKLEPKVTPTVQNSLADIEEDDEKKQAELLDIQKELEAKFDELFGSVDE